MGIMRGWNRNEIEGQGSPLWENAIRTETWRMQGDGQVKVWEVNLPCSCQGLKRKGIFWTQETGKRQMWVEGRSKGEGGWVASPCLRKAWEQRGPGFRVSGDCQDRGTQSGRIITPLGQTRASTSFHVARGFFLLLKIFNTLHLLSFLTSNNDH